MGDIQFRIKDEIKEKFKDMVGEGNISKVLNDFIKGYIDFKDNPKKDNLKKQLSLLQTEKDEIDKSYFAIKSKLDVIERIEREKERKRLEKEQEEYKKRKSKRIRVFD